MSTATEWEKQEPGWYTSRLGGISEESPGKWFFWPQTLGPIKRLGPHKTLQEAKARAEDHFRT